MPDCGDPIIPRPNRDQRQERFDLGVRRALLFNPISVQSDQKASADRLYRAVIFFTLPRRIVTYCWRMRGGLAIIVVTFLALSALERDGFRFGHILRWRSSWRIRSVRRR